jgi:hypothetical protein
VQHFINLSAQLEDHMANHPKLTIHNHNPAPQYPGFEQVPERFRPAVDKFMATALNQANFTLERVLAPEFEFVIVIPDIIQMRNDLTILQGTVNGLQGTVDTMNGNIQLIINHLGIQQ